MRSEGRSRSTTACAATLACSVAVSSARVRSKWRMKTRSVAAPIPRVSAENSATRKTRRGGRCPRLAAPPARACCVPITWPSCPCCDRARTRSCRRSRRRGRACSRNCPARRRPCCDPARSPSSRGCRRRCRPRRPQACCLCPVRPRPCCDPARSPSSRAVVAVLVAVARRGARVARCVVVLVVTWRVPGVPWAVVVMARRVARVAGSVVRAGLVVVRAGIGRARAARLAAAGRRAGLAAGAAARSRAFLTAVAATVVVAYRRRLHPVQPEDRRSRTGSPDRRRRHLTVAVSGRIGRASVVGAARA